MRIEAGPIEDVAIQRFVSEGGVCNEPEPLPEIYPFDGSLHNRIYLRAGMTEEQLRGAHWHLALKNLGLIR